MLACTWRDRERARLQAQLIACVHAAPETPSEEQLLASDPQAMMRDSLQHLARRDRQAYTLLYIHVVSGVPVPEIATLRGMSRSAVYRRLTWAKTECRKTYQAHAYARQ